jgi:hypothetical protein
MKKIAWLGTPEERILSIRNFRKYINTIPFEEAVVLTKNNWNDSPKINKDKINISNISEWPTPWELFGQSVFSENEQVLGTFYTLILSNHAKEHDISLGVIDYLTTIQLELIIDSEPLSDFKVINIINVSDLKIQLGIK